MNEWDKLSDAYAQDATVRPTGTVRHPHRAITQADLDDIFAGRPLAEHPRQKASIMRKTYLTADMAELADQQARKEQISMAALLRKALASYLEQAPSNVQPHAV